VPAETDPDFNAWLGTVTPANWDTAYGWGNHAGLYDTIGTASGLISNHESTYDHDLIATALQTESGGLISFWLDGGTSSPNTGEKNWVKMPYAGVINGWYVEADTSGSMVATIEKSTSFPTFNAISGTEKPTLSSQQTNNDTDLTTWTTTFNQGDYIRLSLDSVSTAKKLLITLFTIKDLV
jgi:hypothetical protein